MPGERIETYAKRLSQKIDSSEQFGIIGVSFGGLVAVEMSKQLHPALTILVSSAETRHELKALFRIVGKTTILKILPKVFFNPPRKIACWLFGAKNKALLNQILNDTDLQFAKWAIIELTNWRNTEKLTHQLVKIGGAKDKLIPPKKDKNTQLIANGGHFMVVDRADEVSQLINDVLKKWTL